jgi:deazaflavin-dependent oxidoreductase (nitroreductase family)
VGNITGTGQDRRSVEVVSVQPFAWQGAMNRVARSLVAIPLLSRVVGRWLLTLYVVGRKTGKRYTVPMAYVPHEGALLLGSGFAWAKNLRTGEPVELRYKGRRRVADVQVITDERGVAEHYEVIVRHNPDFARINKIGIASDGTASPDDLHTAWAAGARVMLLTLR